MNQIQILIIQIIILIVHIHQHVLPIVVYVFIDKFYQHVYQKMNHYHLKIMNLMIMKMQIQTIHRIFFFLVQKDNHQIHHKL
jgi:hypothetical protein